MIDPKIFANIVNSGDEPSAVPEMGEAMLRATFIAQVLASLPANNEARSNFDARSKASQLADTCVAACMRDPKNADMLIQGAVASAAALLKVEVEAETEDGAVLKEETEKKKPKKEKKKTPPMRSMVETDGIIVMIDGKPVNYVMSADDSKLLRASADALLVSDGEKNALPSNMKMTKVDGLSYVEIDTGNGTSLLVPANNFQAVGVMESDGKYTFTIRDNLRIGGADGDKFSFDSREITMPSTNVKAAFGDIEDPKALETAIRADMQKAMLVLAEHEARIEAAKQQAEAVDGQPMDVETVASVSAAPSCTPTGGAMSPSVPCIQ